MGDVPVTAKNVIPTGCAAFAEEGQKPLQEAEFDGLPFLAGRPGGYVDRNHAEIAVPRLKVTAFGIHVWPPQAPDDVVGRGSGVQRHAAISLFFGINIDSVVGVRPEARITQLLLLCLGFLDAHHVGMLLLQPFKKTLAGGRANPVGIQRDDAHDQVTRCSVFGGENSAGW